MGQEGTDSQGVAAGRSLPDVRHGWILVGVPSHLERCRMAEGDGRVSAPAPTSSASMASDGIPGMIDHSSG